MDVISLAPGGLIEALAHVAAAASHMGALAQDAQPAAAPLSPVAATPVGPQTEAGDPYSLWSLFLRADVVVKTVMIGLLLASFWVWAVIIDKQLKLSSLNKKADRFEQAFWSGSSLDDLYAHVGLKPDSPIAVVFVAGMREWRRALETGTASATFAPSIKERVDRMMNLTIAREIGVIERNLGFLATVGSAAVYVGLFGTVWGIMNAFRSIAASQETNLAVVAPGIAEALFATALGLLAAIPAVIAYNRYASQTERYLARLEGFADEFSALLSRQLDERSR